MALEPVVEAGGSLTLQVDVITLAGTLGVGNEAGLYAYYYSGGGGTYNTVNRTRVGTTAQQKLVVPTVASASGVIVVGDAATLAVQQFQVFPSGPIVGEALRVWFVAPKPDGTVSTTAPTAVWSLDGSADSAVTVVAGANAGFWYVDLTTGQTNATSGRLLVTGTGVIPTPINILFTTTAASGGGGGGTEDNGMTVNSTSDFPVTTVWTEVTAAAEKTFRFGFATSDEHLFWKVAASQPGVSERGERASLSNNKEQTVNTGRKLWVRGTTAFTVSVHVSA
jgi:hypothetical protein